MPPTPLPRPGGKIAAKGRRLAVMADPNNAERLALLERIALEEIRRFARRGLSREQIRDRAPDAVFDRVSGFDELDDLDDEVDESLDTWLVRALEEVDASLVQGAAADSDRLDAAFATLCARGVLARQGVGWSTREGLTLVLEEAHALRQRGADARGYAFFCDQEIDAAIEDDRLHVAFGAVSGQRDASRAVGDEVVVALREAGLAVRWDGDRAKEILVEPFRWFRRSELDAIAARMVAPSPERLPLLVYAPSAVIAPPQLPSRPAGYYREYVVPTPGVAGPGAQRLVIGRAGEVYYTPNHYQSFVQLR